MKNRTTPRAAAAARRIAWAAVLWGAGVSLAPSAFAAKAVVDDEIIVMLEEGVTLGPLLVRHGLSMTGRFGQRPIFRLKIVGKAKMDAKIKALLNEPGVRFAEPNPIHRGPEPRKNVAWAIGSARPYAEQWAVEHLRLRVAHRMSVGAGVRVAVLDTGVDRRHPALAGKLLPGFDFVDYDPDPSEAGGPANRSYGHGTHVAGIISLVAPGAMIMPLRILDADGIGNAWVLAEAMLHAVDPDGNPHTDDGAHVINLSVSTLTKTELFKTVAKLVACEKRKPDPKAAKTAVDGPGPAASPGDRVRCGGFGGAIVVAAAGNNANDKIREFPAAETSSGLISMAASARSGELASFSNYGWVKLAAPGDEVTSSVPGGTYATWSGTSMAAPMAAGSAALLLAAHRDMTLECAAKRLRSTARQLVRTNLRELDPVAALTGLGDKVKADCK